MSSLKKRLETLALIPWSHEAGTFLTEGCWKSGWEQPIYFLGKRMTNHGGGVLFLNVGGVDVLVTIKMHNNADHLIQLECFRAV